MEIERLRERATRIQEYMRTMNKNSKIRLEKNECDRDNKKNERNGYLCITYFYSAYERITSGNIGPYISMWFNGLTSILHSFFCFWHSFLLFQARPVHRVLIRSVSFLLVYYSLCSVIFLL